MKFKFNLVLLSLTLFFTYFSSTVNAEKNAMRFSLQREDFRQFGLDLHQIIYAEGLITEGTSKRLLEFAKQHELVPGGAIYLDSSGGSILEGIRLGRVIRQLGFDSHIGKQDRVEDTTSYCLSACALAYLGGVSRYIKSTNEIYGVHRFFRNKGDAKDTDIDVA